MLKTKVYAKHCSKCELLKFAEDFHPDNRASDELRSQCKLCQNEVNAKWQKANKEKQAAYSAKHTANNLHKHAAKESHRRARLRNNKTFIVTKAEIKRLLTGQCFYCGKNGKLTLDHVIPLIKGGTHGIGNLVGACINCNCRKQGRFIMEWRKSLN